MTNLDYIDSYFKGELSPEEITSFEQKITGDDGFAEEVSFYCSSMQVAKEQSIEERKNRFRDIYNGLNQGSNKVRTIGQRKWWPYIAAAAVLAAIIVGWQLYSGPSSSIQEVADAYVKTELTQLNTKMSVEKDSMTRAIELYNDKKLTEAQTWFEQLAHSNPLSEEANTNAGIVSLKRGEYDKAINYFTALENLRLFANPGKFYQALTLIKRNQPGDQEMAKKLLQEVSEKKLEKKEIADKWIRDF